MNLFMLKEFGYEKVCKCKMEGELLEIEPNAQQQLTAADLANGS